MPSGRGTGWQSGYRLNKPSRAYSESNHDHPWKRREALVSYFREADSVLTVDSKATGGRTATERGKPAPERKQAEFIP